jgi:hypothetical protein
MSFIDGFIDSSNFVIIDGVPQYMCWGNSYVEKVKNGISFDEIYQIAEFDLLNAKLAASNEHVIRNNEDTISSYQDYDAIEAYDKFSKNPTRNYHAICKNQKIAKMSDKKKVRNCDRKKFRRNSERNAILKSSTKKLRSKRNIRKNDREYKNYINGLLENDYFESGIYTTINDYIYDMSIDSIVNGKYTYGWEEDTYEPYCTCLWCLYDF